MDLGKFFPGAFHQHRAMNLLRDKHAEWVASASPGVWWSVKSVGEWCLPGVPEGSGDPYFEKYEFVKKAQPWPYPTKCWLTANGRTSWDIWFLLGGTGLTQERAHRKTYPELEAELEAVFNPGRSLVAQEIAERLRREREQFRAPVLV